MWENEWGLFSHINQALLRFWMYSTPCMCFDIFICEIKSVYYVSVLKTLIQLLDSYGLLLRCLLESSKCCLLKISSYMLQNWKSYGFWKTIDNIIFIFVFSFYLLLNPEHRFNLSSGECSYLFCEVSIGFELLCLSYTVQTMGCVGKSCRIAPLRLFSSSWVGENFLE